MKEIKDNEAAYHKVYESGWKEFFIKQHYLVPFAFYLPVSFYLLGKFFVVKRVSLRYLLRMILLIPICRGYLE